MEAKRTEERLKVSKTLSGIEPKEVYEKEDVASLESEIGRVGEFPFTRGRFPRGYRDRLWLRQQGFGSESAEKSGKYAEFLVAGGVNNLRYESDTFNQAGVDPDHPMVRDMIGFVGVPTYSIHQMEKVLENIDLGDMYIDFPTGKAPWDDVGKYAMYLAVAERRGVSLAELKGSMVNDPLMAFGLEIAPAPFAFDVAWKYAMDAIEFSARYTPQWHPVVPCGYDIGESGATAIQEVAFDIGERIAYIDAALERGVDFDSVGPRMPLEFTAQIDFFETICKIRAARRMWAKIARERYHASHPRSMTAPVSLQAAGSSMVRQQPIFNIIRLTTETLACVLGGARAIQTVGFDEPIAIVSKDGGLVGAGVNAIIANETGVPLVTDPLGGSYYVEWLTKKIEDEAWALIGKIEEIGGYLNAVRKGFIANEIKKSVIEHERRLSRGDIIRVGENAFQELAKDEIPIRVSKYKNARRNIRKILAEFGHFKQTRDTEKVRLALLNLWRVVKGGSNLIEPAKEAFKSDATMGEVAGMINEAMGYSYDPYRVIKKPDFLNF